MNADQLIQYLSWVVYLVIFASVAVKAVRRPTRANVDIALLFLVPALIILLSLGIQFSLLASDRIISGLTATLLLAIPYMLLRLVDDFSDVPKWLLYVSGGALVVFSALAFVGPSPAPAWLPDLELIYLIGLPLYEVVAFSREAARSTGVTRRRMRAAALGTIFLCIIFVFSALTLFLPEWAGVWRPLSDVSGLLSGLSYVLGFATPSILKRAWQEPELRAFLGRAASLPRLPDTPSIVGEMERGAAASVGAPSASIGLWDAEAGALHFALANGPLDYVPDQEKMTGRAFLSQQALYTDNLARDNPSSAEDARSSNVMALLIAPITAGEKRLGVLTVYSPRAPIFADEDLALVQLLADQAAVILESRALIDEAARVRAREEVTRLKEDFLSAAAHDLKTPLTTLVAQAQLLERRARKDPEAPADLAGIEKVVRETQRLKVLVLELLDAARAEQGQLVGVREDVDLAECARETCEHHGTLRHPCVVEADGPVLGEYDRNRIVQLLENLVENAIKYSPKGGQVRVRVWKERGSNCLSVSDQGIGIPAADLPHIFDRFHRGNNVDDKRFAGMGLGLYICRGIAEQHGGRIWASSSPAGTTFTVALPVTVGAEREGAVA